MSLNEFLPPVLLAAAITFFLRALPFLIFHGEKRMPGWLERLGQALPSAIMAVLIVYCLKDAGTDLRGVALPQFLAVGVVAVTYKWKHQTLFSIASGTLVYMILLANF